MDSSIIEFITSEEMMIVLAIGVVGFVMVSIVYLIENTYRKRKLLHQNEIVIEKEELVQPVEVLTPLVVEEKVELKTPEVVEIKDELEYTNIEPNKEEAIEELKKVSEELAKKEEEEVLLTKFEEEQEENAIISIDELMSKGTSLYQENEVNQYEDEGNEPISIKDIETRIDAMKKDLDMPAKEESEIEVLLQQRIEEISPSKVKLDDLNTITEEKSIYRDDIVFKKSPIISPIFGIEKERDDNSLELENTANYEKFDQEIKKTNEFIKVLKELQKNLD